MRAIHRFVLIMVLALLAPLAAPATFTSAQQSDADLYAQIVAGAKLNPSQSGPRDGVISQRGSSPTTENVGTSATNFYATLTFDGPGEPMAAWDFGYQFSDTGSSAFVLDVTSAGTWRFFTAPNPAPQAEAQAAALKLGPGESNTLDLIVLDGRVLFGVNGELVASGPLPSLPVESVVSLITGYSDGARMDGREFAVRDFEVWPLPFPNQPAATLTPPEPTAPAVATAPPAAPTPSPDETQMFDAVVTALLAREPMVGPSAGSLTQATGATATQSSGVAVSNFMATVAFQTPADGAPWDFGFEFADDGARLTRITVDASGVWVLSTYPDGALASGPAPLLGLNPGVLNTLDLVVAGQFAMLGVNGQLAAVITLPYTAPSDVRLVTGAFTDKIVAGRSIAYRNFTLWVLPDIAAGDDATPPALDAPPATATPSAVEAPQAMAAPAPTAAAEAADPVTQQQATPLAPSEHANGDAEGSEQATRDALGPGKPISP